MRSHPAATALAAALTLLAPASQASAAPAPVTGGSLTWTMVNVYETGAPANTNRTWLGYVTSIGPPFTNGTVDAEAPATGQAVTPGSPRGADKAFPFSYPVASGGTYDAQTGAGSLEFSGTVRFTSSAHGFAITVSNPRIVLADAASQLFATGVGASGSGQSSSAGTPYDRSRPVLDLSAGTRETLPDGTIRISGLAPAIATTDMVWPGGSYPQGAGPDRTPNTFGAFELELQTGGTGAPQPAPTPAPVEQPPATQPDPPVAAPKVAAPKVRCSRTRTKRGGPRTACEIRVAPAVKRIVVRLGSRRLAVVVPRAGVGRFTMLRKRRTLTFVATDAARKELSRRTQTVGG